MSTVVDYAIKEPKYNLKKKQISIPFWVNFLKKIYIYII